MFRKTINRHLEIIRNHRIVSALILILLVFLIIHYIETNAIIHGLGYLLAIYLGIFVMDFSTIAFPKKIINRFKIKKPIKKELLIISVFTFLGLAFLCIRFFLNWDSFSNGLKLGLLPLILFTYPIVLAIFYIFVFKYKLKNLGFNLNYWYIPIFIHIIFGTITLLVAPEGSHWSKQIVGYGVFDLLYTGIIKAALSEEFTRMLFLTRIGKLANNMALGLLLSAIIWASMHFPMFYNQGGDVFKTFIACANLIPLGLLWGYITYRAKSIVPSLFIHGMNLWGLQNF